MYIVFLFQFFLEIFISIPGKFPILTRNVFRNGLFLVVGCVAALCFTMLLSWAGFGVRWGGMSAVVFVRKLYLPMPSIDWKFQSPSPVMPFFCVVTVLFLSFVCPLLVRPALAKAANQQKRTKSQFARNILGFCLPFPCTKGSFSRDPCIEGMSTNILKGPKKSNASNLSDPRKNLQEISVFFANSAEGVVVFKDFFELLFILDWRDFSGLIAGTVPGCPTTLGLISMNEQSNIRQHARETNG